jgi:hypothetical protein
MAQKAGRLADCPEVEHGDATHSSCSRSPAGTTDWSIVDLLFASIIAVAGTLLGSTTTYVFQRLTAGHAEEFARNEQLRQERLAAYSAFAGAITELRQGVVAVWFRQHRDHPDPEGVYALQAKADRLGAAADHARFRVQMLARDPDLVRRADAVREPIDAIFEAADLPELKTHETRCQELVKAFIAAAGDQVL